MFSLAYASVDHAIQFIKSAGIGAWMGKADITDAFKIMPLHPSQWHLFGIRWRSKLYFSVRLLAAVVVQKYLILSQKRSAGSCWINKLPFVLHLLDDFLVVDFPSSPSDRCISTLKALFSNLNVPLSQEKTIGPSTSIEFVGISLDSQAMKA